MQKTMLAKNRHRFAFAIGLVVLNVGAYAQALIFPSMPSMKEYRNTDYGIKIKFPESWTLNSPQRNELWLGGGAIRGNPAFCFVRISYVQDLGLIGIDTYLAQVTEARQRKTLSIGMPDVQIHQFDIGYLGGRKARRTVYSGTDGGIKTTSLTYQTVNGDNIITLACATETTNFLNIVADFEAIVSTLKFVR